MARGPEAARVNNAERGANRSEAGGVLNSDPVIVNSAEQAAHDAAVAQRTAELQQRHGNTHEGGGSTPVAANDNHAGGHNEGSIGGFFGGVFSWLNLVANVAWAAVKHVGSEMGKGSGAHKAPKAANDNHKPAHH